MVCVSVCLFLTAAREFFLCPCVFAFAVFSCSYMCCIYPPVHFLSLDPHPLRPPCLSLIPEGPAPCSHQGSGELFWVPTPPTHSPSATAALLTCPLPSSLILLGLFLPHHSLFLCLQPKQAWLCFLPRCARAPQPGPSTVTPTLPKALIQPTVVFTCVAPPDFPLVSLPQSPSRLIVQAHFPQHNLSVRLQSLISRLR